MKTPKHKILALALFGVVALSSLFVLNLAEQAFADNYNIDIGTGDEGRTTSGCSGGAYNTNVGYNCCAAGTRCPHYIYTTDYQEFSQAGGSSSICQKAKWIVYVGVKNNDGTHTFTNAHNGSADYKEKWATSDFGEDSSHIVNWGATGIKGSDNLGKVNINGLDIDPTGFAAEIENGITIGRFKDIIKELGQALGSSNPLANGAWPLWNLTYFCDAMFGTNDDQTKYISQSIATGKSSSDSVTADTGYAHEETETETLAADPGETVTIKIKHNMKIESSGEDISSKLKGISKWTVSSSGKNHQTRSPNTGTFAPTAKPGEATVAKNFTVSSFTVPKDASDGTTYTICEQIKYDLYSKNGKKKGSETSWTKACIKIQVGGEASEDNPEDLCLRYTKFMQYNQHTLDEGISEAWSKVTKNADEDWKQLVYAKPRDNVRFLHCYYPYANTAKNSEKHGEHYEYCANGYTDENGNFHCTEYRWAARSSGKRNVYIADKAWCRIYADAEGYLFKYDITEDNKKLCNGNLPDQHRETPVGIISPAQKSKAYKCVGGKVGFYQIVGIDPRECTTDVSSVHDVGTTFMQWIEFGGTLAAGSKLEPHSDSLDDPHGDYYITNYKRDGDSKSEEAVVVVPYNFNTTTEITDFSRQIVYPGEEVSFGSKVKITPRVNPDVDSDEYATVTPDETKIRLYQCIVSPSVSNPVDLSGDVAKNPENFIKGKSGAYDCVDEEIEDGALNPTSKESGKKYTYGHDYVVPDEEAGTKYCVAVAIFPADSHDIKSRIGGDLKKGDNERGGQEDDGWTYWRISDIKCSTIAKKPNAQVWGAGVYSGGAVTGITSPKCVDQSLGTGDSCDWQKREFGSWAENEVIAIGKVDKFGSMNGYGYESGFSRDDYYLGAEEVVDGAVGGNSSPGNFRKVSNLTIANDNSAYGGYSNITVDHNVLDRILARYSRTQNYADNASGTNGEINLGPGGGTIVIYTNQDFEIRDNIKVDDNEVYSSIEEIPQVLIIAPNIKIKSNVTRVDAWLIALNGNVDTCSDFNSNTQSVGACSDQLTVNGPIFTNKLYLHRTAGAGMGALSINPAERFNLSAANYYWAYAQAEVLQQAFTTYTRELAPRY